MHDSEHATDVEPPDRSASLRALRRAQFAHRRVISGWASDILALRRENRLGCRWRAGADEHACRRMISKLRGDAPHG